MEYTPNPFSLRYVLYHTLFAKDITLETYADPSCLLKLEQDHGTENFNQIISGLEWGIAHPEYQFNQLLPGLPHSNAEIHTYLKNLYKSWKQLKE